MDLKKIRFKIVQFIYADHNRSSVVQSKLKHCLSELNSHDIAINVGAGATNIHPQVRNLDIFSGENIYYVAKAESIPEVDNYFNLAISQEVLEHVENPILAVNEIHRVLKKGGKFYCQVPFIIGYHPGPNDYWRFTKEGIVVLLKNAGFDIIEVGVAVGSGTGFYRILVEFFATLFSVIIPNLYIFFKGIFAFCFYPVKFLDYFFKFSNQRDRIPGGYYVIAKKY
jgi:SAM-dependent methyltransferase